MTWNYRIIAHKDGDSYYYEIHEVYYDKTGKPDGYTKNATVGSESIEGIEWSLEKMKECLSKPILSAENFPDEFII